MAVWCASHSPYFDCEKEQSEECKYGWLFYILSELVPVTILFIVILVFNISFTSGALNGFILFSQLIDTLLIDASGIISFPNKVQHAFEAIRLFYGFFNLDFFYIQPLSFCIWKEASALDILVFKYVTVIYSVVLIIGVILFMKHCGPRCPGKIYHESVFRNSVVKGLSAFLVMCYAQCVKVSFNLLYFGTIQVGWLEKNSSVRRRVWYNGELEYFKGGHLAYALPALAVLLTIGIFPPVILITYPAIFQILSCLNLQDSWIDKCLPSFSTMKPFLDAFQGSFKDNCRCFAGIYFLYRWVGVTIHTVTASYSIFYTAVGIILTMMLVLHTLCQPYNKRWHNILDTFLLADLALINSITVVHYYASRVDNGQQYQNRIDKSSILQIVLMYLPVLYLLSYITIQLVKAKYCTKTASQAKEKMQGMEKLHGKSKESKEYDDLPYRLIESDVSTSTVSTTDLSIHHQSDDLMNSNS